MRQLPNLATSSPPPYRRIWLWVILLDVLAMAVSAVFLMGSYRQNEQTATVASQNLAALLSQSVGGEIDQVSLVLATASDEAQREIIDGGIDPDIFAQVLDRQKKRLSFIEGLNATDAVGTIRYGAAVQAKTKISLSDRPYFLALQQDGSRDLVFSRPLQSRVTGTWDMVMARRYLNSRGGFAGAVYASLPISHFNALLASLSLGTNGTAILRSADDFALLARYPILDAYGQTKMSDTFLNNIRETPNQGTYVAHGAADGVERVFTYRRLDHYPLMVIVGLSTQDYRAEWVQDAQKMLGMTALFILTTLIGGWSLFRSGRERQRVLELLRRLLQSAGVGIFGINAQGTCTFCNPAALSMFGLPSAKNLVGRDLHQSVHHSHADGTPYPAEACPVYHSLKNGNDFHGNDVYWRPDGTSFPVEFWIAPQIENQRVTGAVVTFIDITDRQAAAAALEGKTSELARSNAELEQFAYVASHDLREPLRMVASYLGLLERRMHADLDEDCQEFIATAKDGATRMDRLILDLLEYSRIGRNRPPPEPVDMAVVLEEVQAILAVPIEDANAALVVDSNMPMVLADHGEMVRLMQNLIGNALKYRVPERAPRILVSATPAPENSNHGAIWEITITDNGIGIPEEQRERIFGVFQRLHARDTYDGTGIGLAVCRKIVHGHKGQLWVTAAPDGGSVFHFTVKAPIAAQS